VEQRPIVAGERAKWSEKERLTIEEVVEELKGKYDEKAEEMAKLQEEIEVVERILEKMEGRL
jgi:hypothetical protein